MTAEDSPTYEMASDQVYIKSILLDKDAPDIIAAFVVLK